MFRYFFIFVLATFASSQTEAIRASYYSDQLYYYPEQLAEAISSIQLLPEARELIANAQKEGYIHIKLDNYSSGQFDACWDAKSRTVTINIQRNTNDGALICSLLFELYNACATRQIQALTYKAWYRQIDKESYVEQMERIEHDNALATQDLIEIGIKQGVFPKSAHWPISRDFDDHYMLQQISGHSLIIADNFDSLNPFEKHISYVGTVPHLNKLSQTDKQYLMHYLSIKRDMDSPSWAVAQRAQKEFKTRYKSIQKFLASGKDPL